MKKPGQVFLVGAGPGDPDLLTIKAARILGRAQAVVYDRLVSDEVLALVPPLARLIPVGKALDGSVDMRFGREVDHHPVTQDRINALLVKLAQDGLTVVRLKGGDPMIFGRGSEEAASLSAAGVPFQIVPGITAAQGTAAVTGVPLTHRGLASGVRYVTGHCRENLPLDLDWASLADPDTTLVVYMGAAVIGEISRRLIGEGMPRNLPVLAVASATTPRERRVVSCLEDIAEDAAQKHFCGPVLFVIGNAISATWRWPFLPP